MSYPGSVAWIGISSPDNPQPAIFSVVEPSTAAPFAIALLVGVALHAPKNRPTGDFLVPDLRSRDSYMRVIAKLR